MNIVFVSREYPPSKRTGGIGFYVRDMASALVKRGARVWVISASDDTKTHSESVDINGVHVIRLPGGDFCVDRSAVWSRRIHGKIRSLSRYISYRNSISSRLNKLISAEDIDIIEFAEFGNESLQWIREFNKTPSIIRLHGPTMLDRNSETGKPSILRSPLLKLFGYLEFSSLEKAKAISSPSQAMADWVAQKKKGLTINVIPNSVDVAWWHERASRIEKPKTESINILSVGTISQGKGHLELYEAVKILRREGYDIRLTLAGRLTKFGHKLMAYSKQIEKSEWMTVLDFVERELLATMYSQADIVVFPSRWEPFGLVCAEAMSCQALVIASTSGGMSEIVENGVSGFLVEPKSSKILAEKIKEVIDLPIEKKDLIRTNAYRRTKQLYDIESVVNRQLGFYSELKNNYKNH